MAANGVLELTGDNFSDTIKNAKTPVLVDFWATWCGPCKRIAPIVDEIAAEYGEKVVVGKLDIDAHQQIATENGVQSIPTILVFKGGEMVERVVGAVPKKVLTEAVDKHL